MNTKPSIALKFCEIFYTGDACLVYYNGMAHAFITRESSKMVTTLIYRKSIHKKIPLLQNINRYPFNCCLYHLSTKS